MGLEDVVLAIATIISVVPFWSGDLLLATDLPQHLAQAAIARDYPGRGLEAFYFVELRPRPYLGTTYVLIALGAGMTGARVALTLYAIALVLAVRALVRAAPSRDLRLAWFAPVFVCSWPVAYGFLPFVFGLPPAIAAVALARRGHLAAIGVLHLIALLFHPLAFAIGALATLPHLRVRRTLAIPLAVAALLFLVPVPDHAARFGDEHIQTVWRFQIKHKVIDYALAYLPGHLDTALAVPAAAALIWAVIVGRKPRDAFDLSALAIVALYSFAPADLAIGEARISLLGPRILTAAWLFVIVAGPGRLHGVVAIAPLVTTFGLSGLLAMSAYRYGEAWGGEVTRAVAAIPVGSRIEVDVAMPARSPIHEKLLAPPELHLHAYSMLERASFDPALFSAKQTAVQIKQDAPTTGDVLWTQTATPAISIRHRQ